MNNLSVSNWQRKRDNLSSITSSPFLNDTSCLGFSNLFKQPANDLANIKIQRLSDPSTVIIGHLNINSFETNMKCLPHLFKIPIYFLFPNLNWTIPFQISKYPNKQFHMNGFKILRCDHNRYGGGLILYVHEGIPCKPLKMLWSKNRNHWFRISSNKTEMAFCRNVQTACC